MHEDLWPYHVKEIKISPKIHDKAFYIMHLNYKRCQLATFGDDDSPYKFSDDKIDTVYE